MEEYLDCLVLPTGGTRSIHKNRLDSTMRPAVKLIDFTRSGFVKLFSRRQWLGGNWLRVFTTAGTMRERILPAPETSGRRRPGLIPGHAAVSQPRGEYEWDQSVGRRIFVP